MSSTAQTSAPPTREEVELARRSGQRLAHLTKHKGRLTFRVKEAGKEETIELPAEAVKLLMAMLEDMASGHAVTVVPQNAELSTQEAANFLNVSRPFLVELLESGKINHRKVGTHRRIKFEDILSFKEGIDYNRRKVLDELAADAEELGMGY